MTPAIVDTGLPAPNDGQIHALQTAIARDLQTYDIDALTSHHFCDGMYARELLVPAGGVIVGKRHAKQNFFMLVKGEMTVSTPTGMKRISAPFLAVTQPGDKRIGYAHSDCVTMNFHPNPDDCRDMEVLESRYIIPEQLGVETKPAIHDESALEAVA